jgi:hypothetical protein
MNDIYQIIETLFKVSLKTEDKKSLVEEIKEQNSKTPNKQQPIEVKEMDMRNNLLKNSLSKIKAKVTLSPKSRLKDEGKETMNHLSN